MNSIEEMKNRMNKVKAVLEDPQKTTVRLVMNPERMVISETMRALRLHMPLQQERGMSHNKQDHIQGGRSLRFRILQGEAEEQDKT